MRSTDHYPVEPSLNERALRFFARAYPFIAGMPRLANGRFARAIVPKDQRVVWASVSGWRCAVRTDDLVGRTLLIFGDFDGKVSHVFRKIIRRGDTVLDVGANIGATALLASRLTGPRGRVLAFEPSKAALSLLKATLAEVGADNIALFEFGLGDSEGHYAFQVPSGNLGEGQIVGRAEVAGDSTIEVRRLDQVLEETQVRQVNFMKIDVEGFEPQVLSGLLGGTSTLRPEIILFENKEGAANKCFDLLRAGDYRFFGVPDGAMWRMRLLPENADGFSSCIDFIAVHRDTDSSRLSALLHH